MRLDLRRLMALIFILHRPVQHSIRYWVQGIRDELRWYFSCFQWHSTAMKSEWNKILSNKKWFNAAPQLPIYIQQDLFSRDIGLLCPYFTSMTPNMWFHSVHHLVGAWTVIKSPPFLLPDSLLLSYPSMNIPQLMSTGTGSKSSLWYPSLGGAKVTLHNMIQAFMVVNMIMSSHKTQGCLKIFQLNTWTPKSLSTPFLIPSGAE